MNLHPRSLPIVMLLANLVEDHAGLHYPDARIDRFAEIVAAHAAESGFESLQDYYYMLRYDDDSRAALDRLIEELVIGETYFFRDAYPLVVLVDALADLAERAPRREKIRIWSAGCATGEEAVTLAILCERAGILDAVEIVASDISARALARARSGDYGLQSHRLYPRGVDPWIRVEGGRAIVDARLRDRIDWRRVNLVDGESVGAIGTFDAIICRNVLLYFADATVRRVTNHLAPALRPGGRLVVGACESLSRFGTTFECIEQSGAFFYGHRAE